MEKSGFVIVNKGVNEVGLNDKNGHEVLPCIYDKILDYDKDGYVRFIKDKVYGTIDFKGQICIPLSLGLTHLGVFHKGTARARKGKNWGLVSPMGEEIIPFGYKQIEAYSYQQKAYAACTLNGEKGWLSPDGDFVPNKSRQKPEFLTSLPYYLFDADYFLLRLKKWTGDYGYPLQFYYRDTDVPIDASKLYKKGSFIRNDRFLEATQRLQKPIHKTRFLIVSQSLLHLSQFQEFLSLQKNDRCNKKAFQKKDPPFHKRTEMSYKEVVIPPNTFFLVKDVVTYAGITQVLLLHLPEGAISLATKKGYKLSKIKAYTDEHVKLEKAALQDLQIKAGGIVHGFSLSEEWCKRMYWPIGLDEQFKLNKLTNTPIKSPTPEQQRLIDYWANNNSNFSFMWNENKFQTEASNKIQLYKGEITALKVTAIVNPADDPWSSIGKLPQWKENNKTVQKQLKKWYQSALAIAIKQHFESIAFPLPGTGDEHFPADIAASIALKAILEVLESGECSSEIYICCTNQEEAEALVTKNIYIQHVKL